MQINIASNLATTNIYKYASQAPSKYLSNYWQIVYHANALQPCKMSLLMAVATIALNCCLEVLLKSLGFCWVKLKEHERTVWAIRWLF